MRNRRSRILPSLVLLFTFGLGMVWLRQHTLSHASVPAAVHHNPQSVPQTVPQRPVLRLIATHREWNRRPVYRIQNLSIHPLQRISVLSWSGERLTPLYIGNSLEPALEPLRSPPYTLPSGQCLWFPGVSRSAIKVTIEWLEHGTTAYENVPFQ